MPSFGLPGATPLDYTGIPVAVVPLKPFPRRPTITDRKYRPGQMAIISKDPSTGSEGELWYLSNFTSGGDPVWVQLAGGGLDVEEFIVDDSSAPGTNPVVPNASNQITITGGQIAAGSTANVIQTNSLAASTFTIQIQRSSTAASADSDLNGVCHFDSGHFSIDADGFVTLVGGGQAVDEFIPDTGTSPVVPNASGQVNVQGQSTPSISGIQVTGGTNSLDIAMFSPFEGDFAFTQSSASSATNRKLTVSNADTANAASNSQIIATVGGTSSGDAHSLWSIASSHAWSLGADTSDSGNLKLTYDASSSVTPSSGTEILSADSTSGAITFNAAYSFPTTDGSQYQVLATDGSGALDWTGSLMWISSTSPSGGNLDITITGGLGTKFVLVGSALYPSASGNEAIYLLISDDNGSTYETTGYFSGVNTADYTSATYTNTNTTNRINLATTAHSSGEGHGFNFSANLVPRTSGGVVNGLVIDCIGTTADLNAVYFNQHIAWGLWQGTDMVTNIRITCASGLLSFGSVDLYRYITA